MSRPKTINLTFGEALDALKKGKKVSREGWNGKEQFLTLGDNFVFTLVGEIQGQKAHHFDSGSKVIIFNGTRGTQVGWLASQSDMLSEDWRIVND